MAYKDVHESIHEEKEQRRVKRMKVSSVQAEVEEMWNTVGAGDSDLAVVNSVVDTVVHTHAEKVEEENEIDSLFNMGKKKKKNEKSPAEIAMEVETVMAELEVAAEEDAELNRQGKPAINKLMKISLLTEVLSKKQFQQVFLDHGVLTLLKDWLQPLPDGSLPNINVREAILRILMDYPIDLEQLDRRDQLKESGLGKAIMFLSKYEDETTSNRKLAREIVDKWSRPLFNQSTRFEDMRKVEEERVPLRRSVVSRSEIKDGDVEFSRKRTSSSINSRASMPEVSLRAFDRRPESKTDPVENRADNKQGNDQRLARMNKKLQQLKTENKKRSYKATKIIV